VNHRNCKRSIASIFGLCDRTTHSLHFILNLFFGPICFEQNGHLCCTYTSLCINELLISTQTTHKNSAGQSNGQPNGQPNSKMKRIGSTTDRESNEDKSEQTRRESFRHKRNRN
jgi:hypothetical protein